MECESYRIQNRVISLYVFPGHFLLVHALSSAYLSPRRCVNLASWLILAYRARFMQPLREKYALVCTDMQENMGARLHGSRPGTRDSRNLAHIFFCISVLPQVALHSGVRHRHIRHQGSVGRANPHFGGGGGGGGDD